MKNQLTLLHFDDPEDLLRGVETLQRHNIAIREIYSAEPMPGIETKLRIKQQRFGEAILRFGCPGGAALTSLGYYFMGQQSNWKTALLNTLVLLVTLLLAGRLFPFRAPRVFSLKPGDGRYMVVADTQRIPVNPAVAYLFQYTGAVELSPALKNIVTS